MARVGSFLVGQATVEESGCFADAVCGTPVCNDAICGTWWACPPSGGLALGGVAPTLTISVSYVPAAGLGLGALAPQTTILVYAVPVAGLGFGALLPALRISAILFPAPAGLGLAGLSPRYVGQLYLEIIRPADCEPVDLVPAPEEELVLVGAVASEITLEPVECR